MSDLFHALTGTPRETAVEPVPSAPARPENIHTASGPVHWQSVAKTVFRKRTTDGPYSLQLGAYPTMESLLLHLPRFMNQKQPLFWNQDQSGEAPFTLFVGRFESFEQARKIRVPKQLVRYAGGLQAFCGHGGPAHGSAADRPRKHEPWTAGATEHFRTRTGQRHRDPVRP